VALVGLVVALLGAWIVVTLGPSGEASFSSTSKAPGAILVSPDVLNSVDVPVRVSATRLDGRAIWLAVAASTDARAVLSTSAVATVRGVHFPAGTLDLRSSGTGALTDISTADVWRLSARGAGSAGLVVDQGGGQGGAQAGPETAVVTSGDDTALTDVTVTLTWADRKWFLEALVAAMFGAVVAAVALTFLWQSRDAQSRHEQSRHEQGRHEQGRHEQGRT